MSTIDEFASLLDEATRTAAVVGPIDPQGMLSLADAYAVQSASIQRRLARGERRTGVKIGLTSRAKRLEIGADDVIWGRLTSGMQLKEGGTTALTRHVHPRAEAGIAFVLKKPLAGEVTAVEALAAVEAVAPAIEIIDSRYGDAKLGLQDAAADNASAGAYVIGPWASPQQDFSNLGLTLCVDGRVAQVGSTAAILGQPLRALVAAARLAAAAGEPLQAGWVVMAGAATAAQAIKPGQYVSVEIEGLGSAGFHVKG